MTFAGGAVSLLTLSILFTTQPAHADLAQVKQVLGGCFQRAHEQIVAKIHEQNLLSSPDVDYSFCRQASAKFTCKASAAEQEGFGSFEFDFELKRDCTLAKFKKIVYPESQLHPHAQPRRAVPAPRGGSSSGGAAN